MSPVILLKEKSRLYNKVQQQCLNSGALPDILQEKDLQKPEAEMLVGYCISPGNTIAHQNPCQRRGILFPQAEGNFFHLFFMH